MVDHLRSNKNWLEFKKHTDDSMQEGTNKADIEKLIACDHLPCDKNEQFVTSMSLFYHMTSM